MIGNDKDLISILRSREPLYAKPDAVLMTSGMTPQQNLDELLLLARDLTSQPAA
jgi:hypothetical protein